MFVKKKLSFKKKLEAIQDWPFQRCLYSIRWSLLTPSFPKILLRMFHNKEVWHSYT